jgi:hypothetical protein
MAPGTEGVDPDSKAPQRLGQFLYQHRQRRFSGRVMRQVARHASVQRGEEQERAGLMGRDQLTREFACEVKASIDVDRAHLLPGLVAYG